MGNQIEDGLPTLRATHSEQCVVDKEKLLAQITQAQNQVQSCIQDVQGGMEREVLACGTVLSELLDEVRKISEDAERGITSSMERSEKTIARFVQGMREDMAEQERAVTTILDLAAAIEAAVAAIADLTVSSKVLAINARIEAARLGEHGKGFAVIADSLKGLSNVIYGASDKVNSSVLAIRAGIAPIGVHAESIRERTQSFTKEVSEQVHSASRLLDKSEVDGSRLSAVLRLSNDALSHLQFQDPTSQKLQTVNTELLALEQNVQNVLNGELFEVNDAAEHSAAAPTPGEIMLF